jgi:hypothetical protein
MYICAGYAVTVIDLGDLIYDAVHPITPVLGMRNLAWLREIGAHEGLEDNCVEPYFTRRVLS